jgi:hypothetical protein
MGSDENAVAATRLRREVAAMRLSTTWRLGELLVEPAVRMLQMVRRRVR